MQNIQDLPNPFSSLIAVRKSAIANALDLRFVIDDLRFAMIKLLKSQSSNPFSSLIAVRKSDIANALDMRYAICDMRFEIGDDKTVKIPIFANR